MRRHLVVAEVADQTRGYVKQVVASSTECTLRMNATSTAYLMVRAGHPVVPVVEADGMRATLWMVTHDGPSMVKRRLLEGRIGDVSGAGPHGTVRIPIIDDFERFSQLLGWQVPTAAIGSQGSAEFAVYTGPSETRALAMISAAVTRLGLPWDVATSLGRGTAGTTEVRMDPLADKLLEPLTADRLQLRIERNRSTDRWAVSVHEGQTFPRVLTPQSGVLTAWQWIRQRPKFTRVVVGGRGQGVEREHALVVDAALEAELGMILEGFVSASSAEEGADLTPYGLEFLAANRGRSGVTATLSEASWFRFPDAYDLADRLTLQVGAEPVEDVITEINITHDVDTGFRVVPTIGLSVNAPQERLARFVSDVAVTARRLEKG